MSLGRDAHLKLSERKLPSYRKCHFAKPSNQYTPWSIKTRHFYFYYNFGKCGSFVIIILSLLLSQKNCRRSCNKIWHLSLKFVAENLLRNLNVQLCNFTAKAIQLRSDATLFNYSKYLPEMLSSRSHVYVD